ncbi:MAG: hypothetical protein ACTHLW_16690 [Verrucomicrobiota bacterium]
MSTTLSWTAGAPKEDRVRANTKTEINEELDRELEQRLRFYAVQPRAVLSDRIEELDREWDIERALETNAAAVGLAGVLLGMTASRKWFVLPAIVSGFLFQHALQGWCPPLPLFRRMGVRTRIEIEQERYALKLLRGDFKIGEQETNPRDIIKTVQC